MKISNEDLICKIVIFIKIKAAFYELAGCTAKDIDPDDFIKDALEEIKKQKITDKKRINFILSQIGERL